MHIPGVTRDDWPLDDATGQPLERVRQIRDEIEARVSILVKSSSFVSSAAKIPRKTT